MSDGGTDKALLQRAVYYLLDQGAPIELVGDAQDQQFEIDGQPVTGIRSFSRRMRSGWQRRAIRSD